MTLTNLISTLRGNTLKAVNLGFERFSKVPAADRLRKVQGAYEEFLGIKEVRESQKNVLEAESQFVEATKSRRAIQSQLIELQDQLKHVRQKLDKTHRGDENYLELITSEHKLIKNELGVLKNLGSCENVERDLFSTFSQTLRNAHEAERLRQEKSRYLSWIGSLIGAALGIIGATISHSRKMKDINAMLEVIEAQNETANNRILPSLTNESDIAKIVDKVLSEVPHLANKPSTEVSGVTEPQLAQMLSNTESNLESKLKLQTLATVVTTYALIAITIPILMRLLGD